MACDSRGLALDGIHVHADGIHLGDHAAAADRHSVAGAQHLRAPDEGRRAAERVAIGFGLKTEHVVGQHGLQHLAVHRQRAQHFDVGKRDVQEQPDGLRRSRLAQLLRQREQVVVVHPDEIAGFEQRQQQARVALVHALVGLVLRVVVTEAVHEVVKQRPQGAVAEAEIEVAVLGLVHVEGCERDSILAHHGWFVAGDIGGFTIPAEPQSAPRLHGGQQSHREPTGCRATLGHGNAVRNRNQPGHTISSQLRESRSALPITPTML